MVRLTRRSVLRLTAGAATVALPAAGASCNDTDTGNGDDGGPGTMGGFVDAGE